MPTQRLAPNVHSNVIHNCPKLETVSIKQNISIFTMEYYSVIKRSHWYMLQHGDQIQDQHNRYSLKYYTSE